MIYGTLQCVYFLMRFEFEFIDEMHFSCKDQNQLDMNKILLLLLLITLATHYL